MPDMEAALEEKHLTSFQAAGRLLKAYFSNTGQNPRQKTSDFP
jgi:hypothetical protein